MIVITIDYNRISLAALIRECGFGWVMSSGDEPDPSTSFASRFTLQGAGRSRFLVGLAPIREFEKVCAPWRLGNLEHLLVFYHGYTQTYPLRRIHRLVALGGTGRSVPWICNKGGQGEREWLVHEPRTHRFDPRFRTLVVCPIPEGTTS